MDISVNTTQSTQTSLNSNAQTGAAAPATEGQKADQAAQRVVASADSANLENNAKNSEQQLFEAIKKVAEFLRGDNRFLSDFDIKKFTIYNDGRAGGGDSTSQRSIEIRFTDINTGKVEAFGISELFKQADVSANIIKGEI